MTMMLTGTVTDTRKEDKQDGSERSYPGGALGAAAGAVQIGYIKVQPGVMRLRYYTTIWHFGRYKRITSIMQEGQVHVFGVVDILYGWAVQILDFIDTRFGPC
jgi:hypothetical protein